MLISESVTLFLQLKGNIQATPIPYINAEILVLGNKFLGMTILLVYMQNAHK